MKNSRSQKIVQLMLLGFVVMRRAVNRASNFKVHLKKSSPSPLN